MRGTCFRATYRVRTIRVALGPQRGKKVFSLQSLPPLPDQGSRAKLVNEGGFSLHAGVAARADQRDKLERLCRYIARPAVSEKRLSLTANGQVRYQLKTPYWDGTTHVATLETSFTGVAATDTYELYAVANAFIWDESATEFAAIVTGEKHTDTVLEPILYADLHVNSIILEEPLSVPCFETEEVVLPADATTTVEITLTDTRGAFIIMAQGITDTVAGGPTAGTEGAAATWNISKRDSTLAGGSSFRTSHSRGSVVGVNSEKLRLSWPAAGKIFLRHTADPGGAGGETITYRVRIICI